MTREAVRQGIGRWRGFDQEPSTLGHRGVVNGNKAMLTELAAPGLPVTLVTSADGRVVDRRIREISATRLEELVSRLVAEATAP